MHRVRRERAECVLQRHCRTWFVDENDLANTGTELTGSLEFGGCLRRQIGGSDESLIPYPVHGNQCGCGDDQGCGYTCKSMWRCALRPRCEGRGGEGCADRRRDGVKTRAYR